MILGLRITFTKGLKFQTIFLQSSLPEVQSCFKNTKKQCYEQMSLLISMFCLFEEDVLRQR